MGGAGPLSPLSILLLVVLLHILDGFVEFLRKIFHLRGGPRILPGKLCPGYFIVEDPMSGSISRGLGEYHQNIKIFLIAMQRGLRSHEEVQLRQEIKQLLKEAGKLSTPTTFAQAAKLRRMAATKEKQLSKKHEEHSKEKRWSYDTFARALLILKVILYVGLSWHFWGVPVAAVPQHLFQPFGRFLSWRSGDAATGQVMVGILPWLVLTNRVSKFLCQKLSKFLSTIKS